MAIKLGAAANLPNPALAVGLTAYDLTGGYKRGEIVAYDRDAGFYTVRDGKGRFVVSRVERTALRVRD